ncbi:putative anthranilate synthase multifunctional protein TrpC [Protomyces lactucae-debilis]|uniref:Multifunctional tryptophan biosynthesis protein n=1 Tax=Protomyces lactucae-debilis TaxID=2754530 RepID=A0A1Y2FM30_PROLT|nr:putative anthranilate synthase multifunctional protein TrpC [Protomyces lactucae-debilis]ORY84276.1 putative anthranilate synthase multifunctional protein TrpC [Protomyces lactucae-debilis]
MADALDIVVIDNYDSFTWNIVEYLSALTDRTITVFRNDKISVADLVARQPTLLVISPGPGHPSTDAGISSDCIREFAGKIPILGVCMGLQCMFTVFGGIVAGTGEILHGKTSLVEHDGKGLYTGVPQKIAATRYHSLAGTKESLPACLERTSWTENGIIMGARHKEYAMEGVQYHPESILSEAGKMLFANFLKLEAGTWAGNPGFSEGAPVVEKKSILETIHEQRLLDIAASKATPGSTPADLKRLLALNVAPPLIDFKKRLTQNAPHEPALMAEIKRASPSKGDIDLGANAASQALLYAQGGASVISVLTEPQWFKGSLNDLRSVRDVLQGMPNPPALLRKDFIIDTYQIDEARLYGADTILLIVAMLSKEQLQELYSYAKSLGMEPLVEVNNPEEMKVAMDIGAQVVGVNNRNLHDFVVDLNTTSTIAKDLQGGVVLCALSGISTRADVAKYVDEGVGAVLVGEALMRSTDKGAFIATLLGREEQKAKVHTRRRIVKICGTRTPAGAVAAAEAGADLIGMIFAEGRKRTLSMEQAQQVIAAVRTLPARQVSKEPVSTDEWFSMQADYISSCTRPLIVGVFQNQPLSTILHYKASLGLDVIQLHGDEPASWAHLIPGPVIKVFGTGKASGLSKTGLHALPLVDSVSASGVSGGTGSKVSLDGAAQITKEHGDAYILAGGLTPETVAAAIQQTGCRGVDVSSGVEDESGEQSSQKIAAFVKAAREA